jgi:hypothetical protein
LKVSQKDLPLTNIRSLLIPDFKGGQNKFRVIVLVGHGIKSDLRILAKLGLDVYQIAPILAIFDTDFMSRDLLGTNYPTKFMNFQLEDLLMELGCPHKSSKLYNAGDHAIYTLHAMFMLTLKNLVGWWSYRSMHQENMALF